MNVAFADILPTRFAGSAPFGSWVEHNRVIHGGARPGPWRIENAPFAIEPMRALDKRSTRQVVVVGPVQLMKTELAINLVLHTAVHGDTALLFEPTRDLASEMLRERVRPALVDMGLNPELRESIAINSLLKKRDTTQEFRLPNGGGVVALTPGSPSGKIGRTARVSIVDEVDKCQDAGLASAASARTSSYGSRAQVLLVSSPTIDAPGMIWRAWMDGSRGRWHARCQHCEALVDIRWDAAVVFDKTPDGYWLPETAACRCVACGTLWTESERLAAVRDGEYVHDDPDNSTRTFHVPGTAHLFKSLRWIAEEGAQAYRAMVDDGLPEVYQQWVNSWRADPWHDDYTGLSERGLRSANWKPGPAVAGTHRGELDPRCTTVVMGVDCGERAIYAEWVGYGWCPQTDRVLSWGLQYVRFEGVDMETIESPELWERFAAEVDTACWWQPRMKTRLGAARVFIDAGYKPDVIQQWCRLRQRSITAAGARAAWFDAREIPIKGANIEKGACIKLEGRAGYRKPPAILMTQALKTEVYDSFSADKGATTPANVWPVDRRPVGYDDRYFRELTAEVKVGKHLKGGYSFRFEPRKGREGRANEALDCRVYAHAAARYHLKCRLRPLLEGLREQHGQHFSSAS